MLKKNLLTPACTCQSITTLSKSKKPLHSRLYFFLFLFFLLTYKFTSIFLKKIICPPVCISINFKPYFIYYYLFCFWYFLFFSNSSQWILYNLIFISNLIFIFWLFFFVFYSFLIYLFFQFLSSLFYCIYYLSHFGPFFLWIFKKKLSLSILFYLFILSNFDLYSFN